MLWLLLLMLSECAIRRLTLVEATVVSAPSCVVGVSIILLREWLRRQASTHSSEEHRIDVRLNERCPIHCLPLHGLSVHR